MIIKSDWHIHTEASYDASLPLSTIHAAAARFGFKAIGITDHANFNDDKFLADLARSAQMVKAFSASAPRVVLGVELTPIERPEFEYIERYGTREGYVAPHTGIPFAIELARTKEQLMSLGVRYAIGASHWRVDVPNAKMLPPDLDACIREWHRQQMWLAQDERVTILGHPWYHGRGLWYEDLSVIPRTMQEELAAALKQNGKYVECNAHFFHAPRASETFCHQYAELLRFFFETGIPVTYGSDTHKEYAATHLDAERYLTAAGFREGDIVGLPETALW